MRIGIGIGIELSRIFASGTSIDAQAQAHYDRVIADGGAIPAGLLGCSSFFVAVKAVYSTSDITTAISAGYDAHYLGYKLGAGSGTTLGQAAQTLYSCCGASGDVTQATAASQPLLLVHDGAANYYFGSGVSGNDCSSNTLSPVGTTALDVKVYVPVNKNVVAAKTITAQDGGGGANRIFSIEWANVSTGTITFFFNSNFAASLTSSTGVGSVSSFSGWIRVTYSTNGTTGTITFYKSTDGTNWTQLDQQTAASTSLGTSNAKVWVGSNNGGNSYIGAIYRVLVSNSIGGSPVVDFNPNSYTASTSQTSWTSTTGEVWTINKSNGSTFTGVLVDRTIVQGNNTSTSMSVTLAGTQPYTEYLVTAKNGTGNYISRATGNSRSHSGTNIVLNNGTALNFANTATTRQTIIFRSNGASSGIAVNNGAETTGNANTNNGSTLVIAEGAHNITTLICSLGNDSSGQRSSMYTAVKSFNNY